MTDTDHNAKSSAHAIEDLNPDEIAMLMRNQEASGRMLDDIVTYVRGHRERTGCRAWGCMGSRDAAEAMEDLADYQMAQLLMSAIDRILTTEEARQ